MIVLNNCKTQ